MSVRVTVQLHGEFCVTTSMGNVVTPKSRKAQGIVALLATSEDMRRTRKWLQEKLWSDRSSDQANKSLRTALTAIRNSLGEDKVVLGADRTWVWLSKEAVASDLGAPDATKEFLEGFSIPDPEFKDWLVEARLANRPRGGQTEGANSDLARRVAIHCGESATEGQRALSRAVSDQVGRVMSEFIALSFLSRDRGAPDLIVQTAVEEGAQGSVLAVRVIDPVSDEIVHSEHFVVENMRQFLRDQDALGRFCWNLGDLALEKLQSVAHPEAPLTVRSQFAQSTLKNVLSFDPTQMTQAVSVMDQALDQLPAGLFHALKAWAQSSMILEECRVQTTEAEQEIRESLRLAAEANPNDTMVVALGASVRSSLFGDFESGFGPARRVLRENPTNLFALQAMSTGSFARGDHDMAYKASKRSVFISRLSKFEAMCLLHHAVLCIRLRKPEEAIAAARLAAECSPNYRAARRQLVALGTLHEQSDLVEEQIKKLLILEPGFSLDRFLFDRSYPADSLRDAGYLAQAKPFLSDFR